MNRPRVGFRRRLTVLPEPAPGPVVALVPAKDAARTIGPTVEALLTVPGVERVIVVDDGSGDSTGVEAIAAGAVVVRLEVNLGKGAAVREGLQAAADAGVILLVDADTGTSAAGAAPLLDRVLAGDTDLAVGVLPYPGKRGGFGLVRRVARWGIGRACGFRPDAPLSGQRAVRSDVFRAIDLEEGFGLETAMTIDAIRAGFRVAEVAVEIDHRPTGRGVRGFSHRARQGREVARALWFRLIPRRTRLAAVAIATAVLALVAVAAGRSATPPVPAPASSARPVILFSIPGLSWEDLTAELTPALISLAERGSVGAMSIRTSSARPNIFEAYASIGAGNRVRVSTPRIPEEAAGLAFDSYEPFEDGTALQAWSRRVGRTSSWPDPAVVHLGAAALRNVNSTQPVATLPGALGDALASGRLVAAVVGNADLGTGVRSTRTSRRPAAAAVMDSLGRVPAGSVEPGLLRSSPDGPYGVWSDEEKIVDRVRGLLEVAAVVVVDPGDTTRAAAFAEIALPSGAERLRREAVGRADRILGRVAASAPDGAVVIVFAPTPFGPEARLTPVVAAGAGVPRGVLHSPSAKRPGLVTLTDLAPTVLARLEAPPQAGMAGAEWSYRTGGEGRLEGLRRLDQLSIYREKLYLPVIAVYILMQMGVYALAAVLSSRGILSARARRFLKGAALVLVAFPAATFLLRMFPVHEWGHVAGAAALVAITGLTAAGAGWIARRPLGPMSVLLGFTAALLMIDVSTGARLQTASLLGYSPLVGGRFTGIGNSAYAVLGTSALLWTGLMLQRGRRPDAGWIAAAVLGLVVLIDGHPALGSDAGGIVTLVPAFGLALILAHGRRVTGRMVLAIAALTVAALGAVTVLDLARSSQERTHIGRLVEQVGAEGWSIFATVLARKIQTNLSVLRISIWTWLIPAATVFLLYLLVRRRLLGQVLPTSSPLRATVIGALALGVLGFVANDSGVVVPATVLSVLLPFLVYVTALETPVGGSGAEAETEGSPPPAGPAGPAGPPGPARGG